MSVTPIPEALRWEVWARDDFRCVACGSRMFLTVDHIEPESHGGLTVSANLQTLCNPCNIRKSHHLTPFIRPGEECSSLRCWCLPEKLERVEALLSEWLNDPPEVTPALRLELERAHAAADTLASLPEPEVIDDVG